MDARRATTATSLETANQTRIEKAAARPNQHSAAKPTSLSCAQWRMLAKSFVARFLTADLDPAVRDFHEAGVVVLQPPGGSAGVPLLYTALLREAALLTQPGRALATINGRIRVYPCHRCDLLDELLLLAKRFMSPAAQAAPPAHFLRHMEDVIANETSRLQSFHSDLKELGPPASAHDAVAIFLPTCQADEGGADASGTTAWVGYTASVAQYEAGREAHGGRLPLPRRLADGTLGPVTRLGVDAMKTFPPVYTVDLTPPAAVAVFALKVRHAGLALPAGSKWRVTTYCSFVYSPPSATARAARPERSVFEAMPKDLRESLGGDVDFGHSIDGYNNVLSCPCRYP